MIKLVLKKYGWILSLRDDVHSVQNNIHTYNFQTTYNHTLIKQITFYGYQHEKNKENKIDQFWLNTIEKLINLTLIVFVYPNKNAESNI